jgi:hypothetical protein
VGEISRINDIPYMYHYYQIKGQNSSKKGHNSMKFYHSLEILTNKLKNKYQVDMWKETEIISRKPKTNGKMDRQTDNQKSSLELSAQVS